MQTKGQVRGRQVWIKSRAWMTRLCCTCVGPSLACASRSRMRPSLPGHVSGAAGIGMLVKSSKVCGNA